MNLCKLLNLKRIFGHKITPSIVELATLFMQSFKHLFWNIQKCMKLKTVTTTARTQKKENKKAFGVKVEL